MKIEALGRKVRRFAKAAVMAIRHPPLTRSFLAESHLTDAERIKLYELAHGCEIVLEIGSFLGASACAFGAALKAQGKGRMICIDTWNNDAMSEGTRNTWESFLQNTKPFAPYIVPVRGFSYNVVDKVRALADHVDVLFIDGDHSYEGAKSDWDSYRSFVRSGTTVILHDIGWADGVRRVLAEDIQPLVVSEGRLPNLWWGVLR